MPETSLLEIFGALFFGCAVVHTFLCGYILRYSQRFAKDSTASLCFHLLGEIEVVFAIWGLVLMSVFAGLKGSGEALAYLQGLHFVEPFFVFCVMVLCSTRPILQMARQGIQLVSTRLRQWTPWSPPLLDVFCILVLGPLAGSFITEPAAMTVTALLLNAMFDKTSQKLNYLLLAVVFVNVSIGGALTSFAAPPILMVASKWQWDSAFIWLHFGWKSCVAVVINALFFVIFFKNEIQQKFISLHDLQTRLDHSGHSKIPVFVTGVHLLFLVAIVTTAHYQNVFVSLFLLFLGVASVTRRYQDSLRIRESLLVALFLGGIIVFGAFQRWWLEPLLTHMTDGVLFLGAVTLTAITDNAALTFLGSQVEHLTELSKYALVAGAIAGGGLTIIANAPNAAGFSILNKHFKDGINPLHLLLAACVPTLMAIICLWLL